MGRVWKRFDYLTHRWIGIVLGLMVFVWFGSGFVMMYYPYPELTESRELALLRAFEPGSHLVGFRAAARAYLRRGVDVAPFPIVGGRLELWNDRLVYSLWRENGWQIEDAGLVDAASGEVLTPISAGAAARIARAVVGPAPQLARVVLLPMSDHYFMGSEHRGAFPVYRVRFDDKAATDVYVSRNAGTIPAVATRLTRITTWLGTVPHWLYFMWLYYDHPDAWTWVNLILPGIAVLLALTGIVLGVYQLFPRRHRGQWRVSGYHGVSRWHHVAGVVFGLLVLTWALSGAFEVLGVTSDPRPGQGDRVRGGPVHWEAIRIGEADALRHLRSSVGSSVIPRAIDLVQLDGRPGYKFWLTNGPSYWVDAGDGSSRGELSGKAVRHAAGRALGTTGHLTAVRRIDKYDTYYYARHGRERHLPAWRVAFDDANHSVLYLDTVTGVPVGFVDSDVRSWRWWRDALHDIDLPALNNNRPWWDLVVLPLMIGGVVSAITGVWLLLRRLKRMAPARVRARDGELVPVEPAAVSELRRR